VDSAELVDGAVDDSHMASISGRKNMIINGAMTVYQRGTQAAPAGEVFFSLDRWKNFYQGGARATITQDTDVPANQGFGYSHKVDVTTTGDMATSSNAAWVAQQIEAQDVVHIGYGTSTCQTVTLSFWVKSTITGTYIAELHRHDSDRFLSTAYTVSSSNTWEKKTITYGTDTTGVIVNDTGSGLMVNFWLGAGSNYTSGTLGSWNATVANRAVGQVNAMSSTSNNIYFTGVQLELGSVATDFEHRSYGEELARCERYYWRLDRTTGGGNTIATGSNYSNSIAVIFYPRVMRASPTIAKVGTNYALYSDSTNHGAASLAGTTSGTRQCRFLFALAGTRGHAFHLDLDNDDTYFTYDAEL
jgi:hypothetical protein